MSHSLLSLFQRDAEAAAPALTAPRAEPGAWAAAFDAYLADVGRQYASQMEIPAPKRKVAVGCLDLATSALRAGAAVPGGYASPALPQPAAPPKGRARVLVIVAGCLALLNIWMADAGGIISVMALATVFAHSYWNEIAASLRPGRVRGAKPAAPPEPPRLKPVIEDVLRRADDIAALALAQPDPVQPRGLKDTTLEFFQDILEAKAGDDRDFAFKKISRTVGPVLAAEGIGVCTDADKQAAMFQLDIVVDPLRADQYQTVRPALTRDDECLLPGYAKRFVAA